LRPVVRILELGFALGRTQEQGRDGVMTAPSPWRSTIFTSTTTYIEQSNTSTLYLSELVSGTLHAFRVQKGNWRDTPDGLAKAASS
jgi:hypothetical protein